MVERDGLRRGDPGRAGGVLGVRIMFVGCHVSSQGRELHRRARRRWRNPRCHPTVSGLSLVRRGAGAGFSRGLLLEAPGAACQVLGAGCLQLLSAETGSRGLFCRWKHKSLRQPAKLCPKSAPRSRPGWRVEGGSESGLHRRVEAAALSAGLPEHPHQVSQPSRFTHSGSPALFFFAPVTFRWLLTTWFCFPR